MRGPPQSKSHRSQSLWGKGAVEAGAVRGSECACVVPVHQGHFDGQDASIPAQWNKSLTSVRFTVPLQPRASAAVSTRQDHKTPQPRLPPPSVKGHEGERPACSLHTPPMPMISQHPRALPRLGRHQGMLMINQEEESLPFCCGGGMRVKKNGQGVIVHPINGQHYFLSSFTKASAPVVPPARPIHAILKCAKKGQSCLVTSE